LSHSLAVRVATLTLAVLFAVIPVVSTPAFADDTDAPGWLVPNASYAGVWKTEGLPDLDSQITFGYTGVDGNFVLIQADGRLALRYGVNPIGAPNHSETNVLATRTPDGFRWGQFDPGRNSSEFTCTVSNDGANVTCARHAMFNGREFFNNIEMTRLDAGATGAPPSMSAPSSAPFVPGAPLEQGLLAYASEVLQESFRLPEAQEPRQETQNNDTRSLRILSYKGPGGQDLSTGYAAGADGTPWYVAVVIREANVDNARNYITADTIYGTLGKYYLPFPEPFNLAVWRQYRKQDGAPTIERVWVNEDGSVEAVGSALWGQNPATGPGNYMTFRARLFPGSPHHAARTLFPS
jgi:hypothetical protein